MARVESKTYVCTERKEDAVPTARTGVEGTLGNWKAPGLMDEELEQKFHGCMTGECVYHVIPDTNNKHIQKLIQIISKWSLGWRSA